jgi:hypothetical protein
MSAKPTDWGAVHRIRLGHVSKLLLDRYGVELPDDDAGTEDLRILLHVKANANRPEQREKVLLNTIALWAPWMPDDKARQTAAEIALKPLKVTSDWLGRELNVDCATRDRLGIWQIGAIDLDMEARKERRKERRRQQDRERKKRSRRSRADYLADIARGSKKSTKPWVSLGISRATYFRRQSQNGETQSVRKASRQVRLEMRLGASAKVPLLTRGTHPVSRQKRYKQRRNLGKAGLAYVGNADGGEVP